MRLLVLRDPRWVPDLVRLMREGWDWTVRAGAVRALLMIDSREAVQAVRARARSAPGQDRILIEVALRQHDQPPAPRPASPRGA